MKRLILLILIIFYNTQLVYAVIEARSIATDCRIKVINYQPDSVFKFVGYYTYQSTIELEKSEEVLSISMGDTTSWQVVPSGNLIFIKPMEEYATTNMTLITNKRIYYFELFAEYAADIRDPNIIFAMKFLYANSDAIESSENHSNNKLSVDLNKPEELNFFYSISGDVEIAPVKIFDDGDFTYFQFRSRNSEIPAIFAVDADQNESVVNFRIDPYDKRYIIIEKVFRKYSLKLGKKIVCVFNESYII